MRIKSSPFNTTIFKNIWKKHFAPNKSIASFNFIEGVEFYLGNIFSIFFNIGKNLTKGNYYSINVDLDYKNKVFIIYDVPTHFEIKSLEKSNGLKLYKSKQYPGFLINLKNHVTIDDYLLATFSRSSRTKYRRYSKGLESCFDISTKMFFGAINKKEYDDVFEYFMILLKKRFSEKQISNNNMHPAEWSFYKDVAYPLILDKKASLFVLYNNETPIAITYNYHSNNTLIEAITVFDIDYVKFNLGYINNLKLLNWCFENDLDTLDFSKGYFDYKKRMCTNEYDFEYHILYDNNSLKSKVLAFLYFQFYELKAYLRKKDIHTRLHKFSYFILNIKQKPQDKVKILISNITSLPENNTLIKIDHKTNDYSFLKKIVNDFQYTVTEHSNNINVYSVSNQKFTYIISSDSLIQKVTFIY